MIKFFFETFNGIVKIRGIFTTQRSSYCVDFNRRVLTGLVPESGCTLDTRTRSKSQAMLIGVVLSLRLFLVDLFILYTLYFLII